MDSLGEIVQNESQLVVNKSEIKKTLALFFGC